MEEAMDLWNFCPVTFPPTLNVAACQRRCALVSELNSKGEGKRADQHTGVRHVVRIIQSSFDFYNDARLCANDDKYESLRSELKKND